MGRSQPQAAAVIQRPPRGQPNRFHKSLFVVCSATFCLSLTSGGDSILSIISFLFSICSRTSSDLFNGIANVLASDFVCVGASAFFVYHQSVMVCLKVLLITRRALAIRRCLLFSFSLLSGIGCFHASSCGCRSMSTVENLSRRAAAFFTDLTESDVGGVLRICKVFISPTNSRKKTCFN